MNTMDQVGLCMLELLSKDMLADRRRGSFTVLCFLFIVQHAVIFSSVKKDNFQLNSYFFCSKLRLLAQVRTASLKRF